MPTYEELVTSSGDASAAATVEATGCGGNSTAAATGTPTVELGLNVASTADATATPDVLSIGYNASSTANAVATATAPISTSENVVSSAHAVSAAVVVREATATSTAEATATAAYTVDTLAVSSVNAVATAAPQTARTELVVESAAAVAAVQLGQDAAVTSTAAAVSAATLAIDAAETATAAASATAAPATIVAVAVVSEGVATATPLAQMETTVKLHSRGVASSSASVVDPNAQAFWTNTETMAPATWAQVPFNSYAMYDGTLFAAGPDGLFTFGGDLDAGAPIAARVQGDFTDFGDAHMKRVETAYANGVAADRLRLELATRKSKQSYDSHLPSSSAPTNHRFTLGRGMTGTNMRFTLTNPNGAFFDLKSIKLLIGTADRRR